LVNYKNTNDRPPPKSRSLLPGANPEHKSDKKKLIETGKLMETKSIWDDHTTKESEDDDTSNGPAAV